MLRLLAGSARRTMAVTALAAGIGAAFAGTASGETVHWADAAVASSEYGGSVQVQDPVVGLGTSVGSVCTGDVGAPAQACTPGAGVNAVQGGGWSAMQATGAPNTYPSCGDIGTAWAPRSSGSDPESLTALYSAPIDNASRVDIYETNLGGFVTQVQLLTADGGSTTVFTGPDSTTCPGILSIPVAGSAPIVGVKIDTQASGWEEVDAVAVVN